MKVIGRQTALLCGLWVATWLLLLLPDILLYLSGYAVEAAVKGKGIAIAGAIALLISTAKSRRFRMGAIAFLVLNQIVWTGYAVYFGQALTPEHLFLVQYEISDTFSGAMDDWQKLLPWTLAVVAGGAAIAALQWRQGPTLQWRSRISGATLVIALVGTTAAWMLHARIDAAFPGKHTPSIIGSYQALVGAVRMGLTQVAASKLNVQPQTEESVETSDEPVTVMVVMGESINPARLSLYDFKGDTTPNLAAWRANPPEGFALIPRLGFSGGLDTYASVPTFLRAAYWPVQAHKYGVNLFDLAKQQDFKTWYFSAQTLNFLEAAGGAKNAEKIATVPNDDGLPQLLEAVPAQAEKSFVFVHQRSNHTPYTNNCPFEPSLYIFHADAGTSDDKRRAAYDNGLRCWDHAVKTIVEPFLKRPGAVYIFITADHSELMAENGRWGHGFADLRVAMVPMMLLTNRPNADVAALFRSWSPPTTYHLAQTVALALGVRLETPIALPHRFFLNATMPFALAGFMQVDQTGPGAYHVQNFARNGQLMNQEVTSLPEIAKDSVDHIAGTDAPFHAEVH